MNRSIHIIGFWAGITAFFATLIFILFEVSYFLGIFYITMDEMFIYVFSLFITIPFLIEVLSLHFSTPAQKQFWSLGALIFTILYVMLVIADYTIGYIFLGLATLFAAPIFSKKYGIQKLIKYFFVLNGLILPLITFGHFHPNYADFVLVLGIPWAITAPGSMLLLAFWLKQSSSLRNW